MLAVTAPSANVVSVFQKRKQEQEQQQHQREKYQEQQRRELVSQIAMGITAWSAYSTTRPRQDNQPRSFFSQSSSSSTNALALLDPFGLWTWSDAMTQKEQRQQQRAV